VKKIHFSGRGCMARSTARRKRNSKSSSGFGEEEHAFVHDEIVRGIEAKRVQNLIDRGVLEARQVFRVIPARTFHRRLAKGEPLKAPEADAIGRLLRVAETANRIFGDVEFARKYLNLPNPALKGRIPIEMAETDAGAREVEAALSRFAHGDETARDVRLAAGAAGICTRSQWRRQREDRRPIELARARCCLCVI
jgi:putative toxin-antitoxin system antitoxin component (TIGR02293 family)